jgi:urease accessory protein
MAPGRARFPELPHGLGQARALATMLYVGRDAARHLDLARGLAPAPHGGATSFDGMLLLRWAAPEPQALRAGDGGGLCPARGGIRAGAAPAGAVDLLKGTRCN